MPGTIPERVSWAVAALAVEPDDRVLEIGCGPGVAVSLIAEQLDGGTITAIDRSSVAVERACWRNAAHLESGKVTISRTALEEVEPSGARYDKVFAVNVNVFWIRDVGPELELIRRLLAPEGSLFLFWGGTACETKGGAVADTVAAALTAHGFSATQLTPPTADSPLLGFVARPLTA